MSLRCGLLTHSTEERHRESHDADDLPSTPSIVILPPCFLCPQRCSNIGCHSIAYCLGVGALEPECWVQIGHLDIPISFFLPHSN